MLKQKSNLKKVLDNLSSLPVDPPYGHILTESDISKKRRQNVINKIKRLKKAKKENSLKEVLVFPEKTSAADRPVTSRYATTLPKDAEKLKDTLSNVLKVPKARLDKFMSVFNTTSQNISNEFLESIAPTFLAYEDAINYSTVVLRDALSYDGDIDMEIVPLLEWLTRLSVLELFLKQINISDEVKNKFLRHATIKAVDKAFATKLVSPGTNLENKVAGVVTKMKGSDIEKQRKAVELINQLKNTSQNLRSKPEVGPIGTFVPRKRN